MKELENYYSSLNYDELLNIKSRMTSTFIRFVKPEFITKPFYIQMYKGYTEELLLLDSEIYKRKSNKKFKDKIKQKPLMRTEKTYVIVVKKYRKLMTKYELYEHKIVNNNIYSHGKACICIKKLEKECLEQAQNSDDVIKTCDGFKVRTATGFSEVKLVEI